MTNDETFTPPDSPPTPSSTGEAVKRLLASLLTSKKVVTAVVGLVVLACARRGIVLQPDMVAEVVTIFAVLIGAQGLADTGKEKAKVEAQSPQMQSALSWKDVARVGAVVAPAVLPGRAGEIASVVTGRDMHELRQRLDAQDALLASFDKRLDAVEGRR